MQIKFPCFLLLILGLFLFPSCDTNPASSNDEGPGTDTFSHTQGPGQSGGDFITDESFKRLVIEIDYMPGAEPDDQALDGLKTFLEQWIEKTQVILEQPSEIPSGGQQAYTDNEVRSLEEDHRDTFSDEGSETLAAYMIFLDGRYSQNNVLGIAYYNTSTAYFGETIRQVSGSPPVSPSREKIEGTVFRHEFGHLFGLVDNGTDMQENHHDSDNVAHCTNEQCLMYYAVQTSDFFANLFDGSIPELDDFCAADVNAVKE